MSITGNSGQSGRGLFLSALTWLANIVAGMVAFFGASPLFNETISLVRAQTVAAYGYGLNDFVDFAWFGLCALLIFFIVKVIVGTAFTVGGMAFADRFL